MMLSLAGMNTLDIYSSSSRSLVPQSFRLRQPHYISIIVSCIDNTAYQVLVAAYLSHSSRVTRSRKTSATFSTLGYIMPL